MSFMGCQTAISKRLFTKTQYITVTVTALVAITEQPGIVKRSIYFAFRANYTYGLFMGCICCVSVSSVTVLR